MGRLVNGPVRGRPERVLRSRTSRRAPFGNHDTGHLPRRRAENDADNFLGAVSSPPHPCGLAVWAESLSSPGGEERVQAGMGEEGYGFERWYRPFRKQGTDQVRILRARSLRAAAILVV